MPFKLPESKHTTGVSLLIETPRYFRLTSAITYVVEDDFPAALRESLRKLLLEAREREVEPPTEVLGVRIGGAAARVDDEVGQTTIDEETGQTTIVVPPFNDCDDAHWKEKVGATDLASIPTVLWGLLAPYGRHLLAAIVHDYLCQQAEHHSGRDGFLVRSAADEVFWYALQDGERVDNKKHQYKTQADKAPKSEAPGKLPTSPPFGGSCCGPVSPWVDCGASGGGRSPC